MTAHRRRWMDVVLSVPLAYKLVAASVAVAAFVAWGALAAGRHLSAMQAIPEGALIAAAFAAGAGLLAAVNGLLVHLALRPIRELERAAGRVEAGDLSARAEPTPFADRRLERVTELFNDGLDGITELRSRLREVARRAVERREQERRELAGRLQEDVAQRVAACLLKLKVARAATGEEEDREAQLDELRDEAAAVLESVRRLARDLHPPELNDIGVGRAIQAFARSFAESTGMEVEVEVNRDPGNGGALDDEARLSLYRIAQDLLMNVVQRAECRAVRVRLRTNPEWVTLELRGRREERTAPVPWANSPELAEIRERAGYAGGRVIADGTGEWSRIRVELPAAADDADAAGVGPVPAAATG